MAIVQIQEAKTKLGEMTEEIRGEGALTAHKPDLRAYLRGGPKVDSFEVMRDRDTGRDDSL